MKIYITIDVGNDAMFTGSDVANLLNEVGDAFREYGWTLPERFRDANGNTVCRVVVDDASDDDDNETESLWWVIVKTNPNEWAPERHGPFKRDAAQAVAHARATAVPVSADIRLEEQKD